MTVELQTFEVPGARTYFGHALPYGLQVKSNDTSSSAPPVAESTAALRALGESGRLQDLLEKHGAVLIRGAGHPSAETFSKLVGAAERGRGSHSHVQIGLAGKRTPLADNVWTANEGSPTTRFYQHNEVRAFRLGLSANVFEKVQAAIPELVEEISKRGLGMKMVFRAPGNEAKVNQFNWAGEHSFGQELTPEDDEATTRQKVEKQVRKLTSDFKWNEDESLELTQHIPGIRRLPASGRPVWFNGLVGRHGITRDIGALDPPYMGRDGMTYLPSVYGDDTEIPRRLLDKLIDVIDKEEISLVLEEGDLLLVDNYQVSHGREPWQGDRQILVSMWDTPIPIGKY
ncbi:hypothetical protein CFIO01_00303 [Colletotrichum fioriniae PJ7]|uniref:TauD/TfdA-like domain-containing protein n=1 Tax=Colletotrichum fioriniae PJ7 TaxID=1445577 RepID=A0A010S194_9PEZI|nr:hypothetical protein CFIO01_00303 [Colletotrichum fioriniae PJ7]